MKANVKEEHAWAMRELPHEPESENEFWVILKKKFHVCGVAIWIHSIGKISF